MEEGSGFGVGRLPGGGTHGGDEVCVRAVLRFSITSCVAWRVVGTLSMVSPPPRPGRGPMLTASPWALSAALCAACVCLVFGYAAAFNGDLSPWDVSSVTSLSKRTSIGGEGGGGEGGHVADGWWWTSGGVCAWWKWRGEAAGLLCVLRGLRRVCCDTQLCSLKEREGRRGSNACAGNDT